MNYHDDEPRKPTQLPPGDLSDAVGTHEEMPYDEDGDDEDGHEDDDED